MEKLASQAHPNNNNNNIQTNNLALPDENKDFIGK